MNLTKEQFQKIVRRFDTLLVIPSDVRQAFEFIQEVLEAEADAIKATEPYATKSIDQLEQAAYAVHELRREMEEEDFREAG